MESQQQHGTQSVGEAELHVKMRLLLGKFFTSSKQNRARSALAAAHRHQVPAHPLKSLGAGPRNSWHRRTFNLSQLPHPPHILTALLRARKAINIAHRPHLQHGLQKKFPLLAATWRLALNVLNLCPLSPLFRTTLPVYPLHTRLLVILPQLPAHTFHSACTLSSQVPHSLPSLLLCAERSPSSHQSLRVACAA